jgi:hypothetical protein
VWHTGWMDPHNKQYLFEAGQPASQPGGILLYCTLLEVWPPPWGSE